MDKFITGVIDGKRFSAFMSIHKPSCHNGEDHKWDGEEIMTFHNDERVLKRGEFDKLSDSEQDFLSIASGEVSCSKCGIGAMEYENPSYSEI